MGTENDSFRYKKIVLSACIFSPKPLSNGSMFVGGVQAVLPYGIIRQPHLPLTGKRGAIPAILRFAWKMAIKSCVIVCSFFCGFFVHF